MRNEKFTIEFGLTAAAKLEELTITLGYLREEWFGARWKSTTEFSIIPSKPYVTDQRMIEYYFD